MLSHGRRARAAAVHGILYPRRCAEPPHSACEPARDRAHDRLLRQAVALAEAVAAHRHGDADRDGDEDTREAGQGHLRANAVIAPPAVWGGISLGRWGLGAQLTWLDAPAVASLLAAQLPVKYLAYAAAFAPDSCAASAHTRGASAW